MVEQLHLFETHSYRVFNFRLLDNHGLIKFIIIKRMDITQTNVTNFDNKRNPHNPVTTHFESERLVHILEMAIQIHSYILGLIFLNPHITNLIFFIK